MTKEDKKIILIVNSILIALTLVGFLIFAFILSN